MSTSMMAAALGQISKDLDITEFTTQVCFSIFVLGLAFAPFVIAALSEMYGRKLIWLVFNMLYVLWNSLCPVGKNPGMMIVGRFMAGSAASVGITLTGPIMADMYRAKYRGRSLAMATLIPYLGPALGPIVGGVTSQGVDWPWLFWILSIFDACIAVVGVFVIVESYTPILLRRKAALQNPTTEPSVRLLSKAFYDELSSRLRIALCRPLRLLVTRPIIPVLSFVYALEFGIYCLVLSTYATLWIDRYHESKGISSLNYIAIAIGAAFAAQGGGHIMDLIWRRLRNRPNSTVSPEFRVPYMVPAVLLIPIGLFWYGWSVHARISWVMVDVGVIIFTGGIFMVSQAVLAYLLDEFSHGASASAAMRMLSNILGFAFPLFGPRLYKCLGYGWGNSLLAFLYIGLGVPAPVVLWIWGPRLRAVGKD